MEDVRGTDGARQALLIRRLLDREHAEALSDGRSALGLDVKRTYMEMRPALRYVYGYAAGDRGSDRPTPFHRRGRLAAPRAYA